METLYDEKTKIWSGSQFRPFYDKNCSFGRIIFRAMKNYPSNICQISDIDDKVLTNAVAISWAVRIAQHFKKLNLKQDDVVGIIALNSTYVMPVAVACLLHCTPFHAVNPSFAESTIEHIFGLTKAKVIFCDGDIYKKVHLATKAFKPIIYTFNDHIAGVPKVEDLLEPTATEIYYTPANLENGSDQTVAILCSSGTTGLPKAVCITNKISQMFFDFAHSEDVFFSPSALDWYSGTTALVASVSQGCTRIITNKPYTAEYFVELVKKYKITMCILQPRYASPLITCPTATAENLSTIRFLISGGSAMSTATVEKLQKILKNAVLMTSYGFTEGGYISRDWNVSAPGSVGKLLPGVFVRIADDDNQNLEHNTWGEICCRTPNSFAGYYSNALATAETLDAEGWVHSGDIGYFDDRNFLYVVDRKKDTLKCYGCHYWPTEIEDTIAAMPGVADVCVIGIYDEKCGDVAGAVVVKKEGSNISEEDIKKHIAKRLPDKHKQLNNGVCFVDKLPENKNGKLMRREAKAVFMASKEK